MKLNKTLAFLLCVAAAGNFMSCSDSFLDEENVREHTTAYLKTPAGIDDMAAAAYITFRFNYQYDWGAYLNESGTDETTAGGGNSNTPLWDQYNEAINSSRAEISTLWNDMYGMIEQANQIITNTEAYYPRDNENYKTRLGEGHFMRGWAYYMLTVQMGGVPLKLTPSTGVQTYFTRNSEKECWEQIISDFTVAYNNLPTTCPALGRLYKDVAAHFLAKSYLWRASERSDSFNSETTQSDLQNVVKYADEVISNHPLAGNYQDLWANTQVNSAVDKLPEIIFSAQFNQVATTRDRFMNQQHLYFSCVYQNLPGMVRDISGGREFNSVKPSLYTCEVFDRVNDSRFWKSFVTRHNYNNGGKIPTYTEFDEAAGIIPDGKSVGEPRASLGDAGVVYIINHLGDQRYSAHMIDGAMDVQSALKNGKLMSPNAFVLYFKDDTEKNWNNFEGKQGNGIHHQPNRGLTFAKYRDGSRESIASQFGGMNGIIARSAEDYLMAAEAKVRLGQANEALPYINALRKRAGYAEEEDRGYHIDGGIAYLSTSANNGGKDVSYSDRNTYYESNDIDESVRTSTKSIMEFSSIADCYNNSIDKEIIDKLNAGSETEKMIQFLLNERTRELCGEFLRWEDLVRTKSLESRYKAFNYSQSRGGASQFNASKHYYRPIPQSFLDAVTNESGKGLSDSEKREMQNPGY